MFKENRLNHSDISKGADRPTTGLYNNPDNPFNLSRMGYANPAGDRNLPSAMKTRPKIQRTPDGGQQFDSTWKGKSYQMGGGVVAK